MRKIEFIEIPSELGAGTRGASLGIAALKVADQNNDCSFFKDYEPKKISVRNDFLYKDEKSPSALRVEGIYEVYTNLVQQLKATIGDGKFPFILAGDHSTAGGTIAGLKMANPTRKLGVIWVDAHADLHSPYTSPSGNVHGMPLACSLNEDNEESQLKEPNELSKNYWNKMKNLGGIVPKILPEDVVFIALRDFEKPEEHLIQKYGMKVITVDESRTNGMQQVITDSLVYLSECDDIYISFDVDSLDSSISKGTGTPVSNGLNESELTELLVGLLKSEKVNCFEVTEINPTLDTENKMAEIALAILKPCLQTIANH